VSENETPHSGSRWEPGATPEPTAAQPTPAPAWAPPQRVDGGAAPATPDQPGRGRLALAAAAVGLVAAGGVGGFVVGQASAGNAGETGETGVEQNGVPGGSEFPGGQFPGGGTRPDGDGDHGVPPGMDGSTDQGTS
jgi:hypothetical protein